MNKEDIMLVQKILNQEETTEEEVSKLKEKVDLIVSQIETQEALNEIMLELNKLNAPAD